MYIIITGLVDGKLAKGTLIHDMDFEIILQQTPYLYSQPEL